MVAEHSLSLAFGILGNFFSSLVSIAPMTTFYRVYKKKSTQGFHSVPCVVALFCSMLWIYYVMLKSHSYLLIIINSLGFIIESVYIVVYLSYAPFKAKLFTVRIFVFLSITVFGMVLTSTLLLCRGHKRLIVVGWICDGFSAIVFAAPLSTTWSVIRTKSVEFVPIKLTVCLTISAAIWLCYGVLSKDKSVAV